MYNKIKITESNSEDFVLDYVHKNSERKNLVEIVANRLFAAWFPRSRPADEDLANWVRIAICDAYEAVKILEETNNLKNIQRKNSHSNYSNRNKK